VFAFLLPLLLILTSRPAYACAYSIPVVGRWSALQIGLDIPSTPTWARALVLKAARVWNQAQVWFQQNYFPDGSLYTFVTSASGNVTVSFTMPVAYASIAVGWTQYVLDGPSTILGAHVFLDGNIFNALEEPNITGQKYGFRLALHELGRVLGLGSLIDELDIMNPIETVSLASEAPLISLIDLFALHILASEPYFSSSVIVLNSDQQILLNAWNFLDPQPSSRFVAGFDDSATGCLLRLTARDRVC